MDRTYGEQDGAKDLIMKSICDQHCASTALQQNNKSHHQINSTHYIYMYSKEMQTEVVSS
jgi:hypothetical protein